VLSANDGEEKTAALLNAAAVRERCEIVFAAVARGESQYFVLDLERLGQVADRVAAVTRRRYPDLAVPYHSRWRHFAVGGVDRAELVAAKGDDVERVRARIDLAVVSVLLDAGAGGRWCYHETETGRAWDRSEGLAVASLRAMQQGLFSTNPVEPWRADAAALASLTSDQLAAAFQHGPENPLLGLDSRAALLRRLGKVCAADPDRFGEPARPGNLYDYWRARGRELPAAAMLLTLLLALRAIWPARARLGGVPLGDCGKHRAVPGDGFVPFHKLSQWLAYSLIEPLEAGGVPVIGIDDLTGLAEYRNGGLFLDCGVIGPRNASLLSRPLDPFSEPVVEWRALTVALLDRLAPEVRARLSKPATRFPLACVLEGGSWAAGRELAFEHRPDGSAPITIISDGTLF
jgi:hypothetical protein